MRYPKISFFDMEDTAEAFAFLNPNQVIRSAYIMPCPSDRSVDSCVPSVARPRDDDTRDYNKYCVNMWVTTLMFTLYYSTGVIPL